MISRLLNRLHRVFNKDPQPYPVMDITCTVQGFMSVDSIAITIAHKHGVVVVNLGNKTLNEVLIEINSKQYLSAVLYQPTYSSFLAKGILPAADQDIEDGRLYMSASIFWNEMSVYAGMLREQSNRMFDAEQQLYFHSATDVWLDYWARDYFGNPRKTGETDNQYTPRVVSEIIRLTQNNKAMEVLLSKAIPELNIEITDAPARNWDGRDYHGEFDASATINTKTFLFNEQRTDYWSTIEATANKVKAAGTRLKSISITYEFECNAPVFTAAAFTGEEITIYPYELTEMLSEAGPQYFAAAVYSHESITIEP